MPFATKAKPRPSGTGLGCRAVIAAGILDPGSEWTVFRALQLGNFTSSLLLDDAESIRDGLRPLSGVDADRIAAMLDDDGVIAEYERQREEARSAAGTPAEAQGKTATSNTHVRFTAPSLVFRRGKEIVVAGGWQPLLAYDTLLANFAAGLRRVPPPASPDPLLGFFQYGLTTAEVALLLADGSDPVPDMKEAEIMLASLVSDGRVEGATLGKAPVWRLSRPAGDVLDGTK